MAHSPTPAVVNLGPALTIDHAADLKRELRSAISGADLIHLNFSQVEELDLACLQLVFSARSTARAEGRNLVLVGAPAEHVIRRLRASGFIHAENGAVESLESVLIDF